MALDQYFTATYSIAGGATTDIYFFCGSGMDDPNALIVAKAIGASDFHLIFGGAFTLRRLQSIGAPRDLPVA